MKTSTAHIAQMTEEQRAQAIAKVRQSIKDATAVFSARVAEADNARKTLHLLPESIQATVRRSLEALVKDASDRLDGYKARLQRLQDDRETEETALELGKKVLASMAHRFQSGNDLHGLRGYGLTINVAPRGQGAEVYVTRRRIQDTDGDM